MRKIKRNIPLLYRVIVKPDQIEEVSEGGIILAHKDKNREQQAGVLGTIVEIGDKAWKEEEEGTLLPKVGDTVLFAKHAGYAITIHGELHRVMNDEDIVCVVEEE